MRTDKSQKHHCFCWMLQSRKDGDFSLHTFGLLELCTALIPKLQMRRKYEVYALGDLLRGNRKAIQSFSSVNGPDVLYDLFSYLVERDGDSMTIKLLSKLSPSRTIS